MTDIITTRRRLPGQLRPLLRRALSITRRTVEVMFTLLGRGFITMLLVVPFAGLIDAAFDAKERRNEFKQLFLDAFDSPAEFAHWQAIAGANRGAWACLALALVVVVVMWVVARRIGGGQVVKGIARCVQGFTLVPIALLAFETVNTFPRHANAADVGALSFVLVGLGCVLWVATAFAGGLGLENDSAKDR